MFLKEYKGVIILHRDTRNFNGGNYQKHKVSHSIYLQRFYQTLLPPTKIKWYLKNLRYLKISDIEYCIYILFFLKSNLVIFESIRMKKVKIFEDPRYFSRDNKDCIRVCIKSGYPQLRKKDC